ncbi:MAG: methyltransferase domain-containing protein [Candidatus Wildermuthbacteria bacterium]|nr:methyltransferase domain-containing protein [Candidatus Wildermuthbacteria bacterium]
MHYETIWKKMKVRDPKMWPTWPILSSYVKEARTIAEVGAGSLPKFPIQGTHFLDTSPSSIEALKNMGGKGEAISAEEPFPYPDGFFDLAGAFEVLEHLEHPENAFREISRVLKKEGRLIFSTPIHQKYFSRWDAFAGHVQRFETEQLDGLLQDQGFILEHCYVFRRARKKFIPLFSFFHMIGYAFVSRFPQCYYKWDIVFYPFSWILRAMARPVRFDSLSKVPPDALTLLAVCRKVS